jgi:outer membrane protein
MRKPLLFVLSVSLLIWAAPAMAEVKLAYIDSDVLKERLPEFKDAQRTLDQLKQEFEREAKDREAKLLKLQDDFKKQELLMSEARKAELQAEFEEKVKALQEYSQQKFGQDGELMKKNVELSSPIFEKINQALQQLSRNEGYDFIFDAAAPGTGIVFAQDKHNVTEKVLQILQEERDKAEKGQPTTPAQR